MDKQLYDARGKQSSIGRLIAFDREAYVHMLFYRVLIILSIIAAAIFVLYYLFGIPSIIFELMFVLVWIFFTPQVYETSKGISIMATKGLVFGYLSKSYMKTAEKYKKHPLTPLYRAFPYAVIALWVLGLVIISLAWFA